VGLEPEPSGDYPDCYSMFGTRFFLGVSERSVGDLDFRFHPSPTVPQVSVYDPRRRGL